MLEFTHPIMSAWAARGPRVCLIRSAWWHLVKITLCVCVSAPLTEEPPRILFPSENKLLSMDVQLGKTGFCLFVCVFFWILYYLLFKRAVCGVYTVRIFFMCMEYPRWYMKVWTTGERITFPFIQMVISQLVWEMYLKRVCFCSGILYFFIFSYVSRKSYIRITLKSQKNHHWLADGSTRTQLLPLFCTNEVYYRIHHYKNEPCGPWEHY